MCSCEEKSGIRCAGINCNLNGKSPLVIDENSRKRSAKSPGILRAYNEDSIERVYRLIDLS